MLVFWRSAVGKALVICEGSAFITNVGLVVSGICAGTCLLLLAVCPQHFQACWPVWRIVLVGVMALAAASHVQWVKQCLTVLCQSTLAEFQKKKQKK